MITQYIRKDKSNMKSLLILGAEGYGQLVKELAELLGYCNENFFDYNSINEIGKLS